MAGHGRLYTSAGAAFTTRPFGCLVPVYANLTVSPFVLDGTFAPLTFNTDSRSMEETNLTVEKMVANVDNKVMFEIVDDLDVPQVLHLIDHYVKEMEPYAEYSTPVQNYFRLVDNLRKMIWPLFQRVIRKHPNLAEQYSCEQRSPVHALMNRLDEMRLTQGLAPAKIEKTASTGAFVDASELRRFMADPRPMEAKLAEISPGSLYSA